MHIHNIFHILHSVKIMGEPRVHAAAQSAAVPGHRSFRRYVKSALNVAAEAGAYSVGFEGVRGVLPGFTVYLSGEWARGRTVHTAAHRATTQPSGRNLATELAQPKRATQGARCAGSAGCTARARLQGRR